MYYRQVGLVLTHLVVLSAGLPPATFWAWALVRETILSVDKVIFASLFFIGFVKLSCFDRLLGCRVFGCPRVVLVRQTYSGLLPRRNFWGYTKGEQGRKSQ
jgi:hypothetical protein